MTRGDCLLLGTQRNVLPSGAGTVVVKEPPTRWTTQDRDSLLADSTRVEDICCLHRQVSLLGRLAGSREQQPRLGL